MDKLLLVLYIISLLACVANMLIEEKPTNRWPWVICCLAWIVAILERLF